MKIKTKDITTETEILNAAKLIFQQKGLDGARMQEIADEAGINKALLHYYFRNKQLLFETVFYNAFSLIAPQIKSILDDSSSIEDKIKNFTYNYISFISEHPYLPNFVFQELNRNTDFISKVNKTIGFPTLHKFKAQLESEIKNGILIPIKAEQLFINILALNIFPFLGKPLLKSITETNEESFQLIMEERKIEVANFIINSIKRK